MSRGGGRSCVVVVAGLVGGAVSGVWSCVGSVVVRSRWVLGRVVVGGRGSVWRCGCRAGGVSVRGFWVWLAGRCLSCVVAGRVCAVRAWLGVAGRCVSWPEGARVAAGGRGLSGLRPREACQGARPETGRKETPAGTIMGAYFDGRPRAEFRAQSGFSATQPKPRFPSSPNPARVQARQDVVEAVPIPTPGTLTKARRVGPGPSAPGRSSASPHPDTRHPHEGAPGRPGSERVQMVWGSHTRLRARSHTMTRRVGPGPSRARRVMARVRSRNRRCG